MRGSECLDPVSLWCAFGQNGEVLLFWLVWHLDELSAFQVGEVSVDVIGPLTGSAKRILVAAWARS